MKYYVYKHTRLDRNEVFYIGFGTKGKKSPYSRAYSKSRNGIWKYIVQKTEYVVEIVFESDSREAALQKEIELIKFYGRKNLNAGTLCNLTDGGEGNHNTVVSAETRLKKSIKAKEMGIRPPDNTGMIRSQETKDKISKANTGKIKPSMKGLDNHKSTPIVQKNPTTLELICVYNSITEATKKTKVSKSKIEKYIRENKGMAGGYVWEYITREEYVHLNSTFNTPSLDIGCSQKVSVKAIFNTGEEKIYQSVSDAAKENNLKTSNIVKVLKNTRNHTGNIKFEYYNG